MQKECIKRVCKSSFTTEAGLTDILRDMRTFAPAESYSMIIGCHGMGWLPVVQSRSKAKEDFVYHWDYENIPMTRFFGGLTAEYQTDISTLAKSLSNNGLLMEYILFDDCYMSSLEVAYELRHVTNYMIACPTEVMVLVCHMLQWANIFYQRIRTIKQYASLFISFIPTINILMEHWL